MRFPWSNVGANDWKSNQPSETWNANASKPRAWTALQLRPRHRRPGARAGWASRFEEVPLPHVTTGPGPRAGERSLGRAQNDKFLTWVRENDPFTRISVTFKCKRSALLQRASCWHDEPVPRRTDAHALRARGARLHYRIRAGYRERPSDAMKAHIIGYE